MAIYFVLTTLCWLPLLIGRRPSNTQTALIFLGSAFFAGFRYETGYDWPVYTAFYETLTSVGNLVVFSTPAFVLWVNVFKALKIDYLNFQLSISFILSLFLYLSLKSTVRGATYVAYLFYISVIDLYLIHHFSILRQGIALGLVWLGIRFYCREQKFWYIFIFLAAMFQVTALCMFLGVALSWVINKSRLTLSLILFLCALNFLFNLKGLSGFISFISLNSEWVNLYLGRDTFNASTLYKIYIVAWVVIAVRLVYWAQFHKFILWPDFSRQRVVGISFAAPILYLLTYDMPTVSSRIPAFFGFGIVVLSAEFLLSRRLQNRVLFAYAGFGLSAALLYRFLSDPLSLVYVPYQTWLFNFNVENSTGLARTQTLIENLNSLWGL